MYGYEDDISVITDKDTHRFASNVQQSIKEGFKVSSTKILDDGTCVAIMLKEQTDD